VIVFVLIGHVPTVLLIALLAMLYLVVMDMRAEPDLSLQVKLWWFLLVALFNAPALIAEKVWLLSRHRRMAATGREPTRKP
jgi:pheromone shutdown protein TraB